MNIQENKPEKLLIFSYLLFYSSTTFFRVHWCVGLLLMLHIDFALSLSLSLSYRCLFPPLSEFWFHYILILIGLNILIKIDFRFHSGQNDSALLDFILSPWVGGSVVFVCPLSVLRIWIVCCVRPRCISGVKNHLSFFRVFYFQYRHKSKQIDAIWLVSRIG